MEAVDYKCPSCSAYIHFNPETQGWKCDYCGSQFELKDLKANQEKFDKKVIKKEPTEMLEKKFDIDMDVYHCPDCGANIITDTNTSATFCVYCKNTAIIKERLAGAYAPDKLIPFKNVKKDAIAAFEKLCKGKILMPKEFSNPKNIQEISGIYIPFWLFDCSASGSIEGKATRITVWSTGNRRFTKTDTYLVKRGGDFKFIKVPVDGSIKFDDATMNSIEPYDYNGLQDFNHSYLSGFLSEKYDVNKDKAYENAESRATETLYENLNQQIVGYNTKVISSKTANATLEKVEYVLLPVWMLNIKYKDKFHTFAMNGQTGKMVGNIPYAKDKAFYVFAIIFIISLLILIAITYLV